MTMGGPDELYEALARWQWQRRPRHLAPGEGLELRKRLVGSAVGATPERPSDGGAGLDRWLQSLLGDRPRQRVLDLGCGFGASLLRWARAGATRCVGIGASAFQVERATASANALGLATVCTFHCGDFAAMPDGPFDVVLAIESLTHAADLSAILRRVRAVLPRTGILLLVDDVRTDPTPAHDADVQALARHWRSPPVRTASEIRTAVATAGLAVEREIDLTAQVPFGTAASIRRRMFWLGVVRYLLPSRRQRLVVAAFLGGVHLERLHSRGMAQYRVWMCQPEGGR